MVDEVQAPQAMSVTIVFSPEPREMREWTVPVPMGRLVADVLSMCAVHWGVPVVELTAMDVGVWGKRVSVDQPLRNGDRLEIYRPLRVDPKVARGSGLCAKEQNPRAFLPRGARVGRQVTELTARYA